MCAVGNQTIELCKQKDIKDSVFCLEHTQSSQESNVSRSKKSSFLKKEPVVEFTDSEDEEVLKQRNPDSLKSFSNSSKKISLVSADESRNNAFIWLMEKVETLKNNLAALENMPSEHKSASIF